MNRKCIALLTWTMALCALVPYSSIAADERRDDADVLIIGAGLAGLSAALEAARAGALVTVMDTASVFGGHAVMSGGDVAIIDTPLQRSKGIKDSPDIAFKDFIEWGKDANPDWVRYYVNNSRAEIYDWLTGMGVTFDGLHDYPGNSVPRAHTTVGRGLGLVSPLYRECLKYSNISFVWNTRAVELLLVGKRVVGLNSRNRRTGQDREFHARAVVLATGGFQSNLKLVREHWPQDLPIPDRLLAGSGINSMGSGLELATGAGAATFSLDHQWNYERGLPDPRYPGENRGLNATVEGVRVNARGELFSIGGEGSSNEALIAVLNQPGATYWIIFDDKSKKTFWISGSNWGRFATIKKYILDNADVVKRGHTIDELSMKTGMPAKVLKCSIEQYNAGPNKIRTAPFYAAEFFPMTRKSMGGITIDLSARVLDRQNDLVPGLYAAGEVSGEAGINGQAALEGTFLGPAVVIGRKAARSAVADQALMRLKVPVSSFVSAPTPTRVTFQNGSCTGCHHLEGLVDKQREGYWHFEQVHREVLARGSQCAQCHAEMRMTPDRQHVLDRMTQIDNCKICHVAQ